MSTTRKSFVRLEWFALLLFLGTCQLGCSGKNQPSVAAPLDKLNKGSLKAKLEALEDLRKLGPNAKSAVPVLIKMLEDEKAILSGVDAAVAERVILRKEDANPSLRASAALTLGTIGPDAKPAIPTLLASLKDKTWNVRLACAEALARIRVKEEKIITAVKDAMFAEKDSTWRVDLAKSLVKLDPENKDAISVVIKVLLTDEEPENRSSAALSLGGMTKSTQIRIALPALITALKDSDEHVREFVAQSLGQICEGSSTVVPALIERLERDKSKSVRVQAAQALGEFGPEAKAAIQALTRVSQDMDSELRGIAVQSLGQIKTWKKKRGQNGMQEQAKEMRKKQK